MADKAWASLPAATPDLTTEIPTATHGGVWKKTPLLTWLNGVTKSNADVSTTGTFSIPAGRWLLAVSVKNASGSPRTVSIGATAGTNEYAEYEIPANSEEDFPLLRFGGSAGKAMQITVSGTLTLNYLFL